MGRSLADLSWPVLSERLRIDRATPDDARHTWRYWQLAETVEWLPTAPASLEAHTERFTEPSRLAVTLIVRRDGEVIGDLMFALHDGWAQTEVSAEGADAEAILGYVFDPVHSGRGFATEAVAAMLEAGFRDLGIRRVTASLFSDNHASARLLERLGFRLERRGKADGLHRTRGWLDGLDYALLADEWIRGDVAPSDDDLRRMAG